MSSLAITKLNTDTVIDVARLQIESNTISFIVVLGIPFGG